MQIHGRRGPARFRINLFVLLVPLGILCCFVYLKLLRLEPVLLPTDGEGQQDAWQPNQSAATKKRAQQASLPSPQKTPVEFAIARRQVRTNNNNINNHKKNANNNDNLTCLQRYPKPMLRTELTAAQVALVKKYATGKKSYLEWGTGGSTDVISRFIDGPAYSIENHPSWCASVQKTPYVACRIQDGTFHFQCIDTGPVVMYGNPKNFTDIPKFANYVQAATKFGPATFDFVMDDGRSRVAVAFQAFQVMHENSILAIHDYPETEDHERRDYRRVEEYFERMEDSVGTSIAIFRKRPGSQGPPPDVFEKELTNYH